MRKWVRDSIARSSTTIGRQLGEAGRSTTALVVTFAVVALAVVASTVGYQMLSTSVTLTVDGEARTVTALGSTVGDVLDSADVELGERDVVLPAVDETVTDGSDITVRHARPLELVVDGESQTHWVTATDVDAALSQIGTRFARASLSASRSAGIDRAGMALEVKTPKTFTVTIGAREPREHQLTALTVAEVLEELDVDLRNKDRVEPALDAELPEGGEVVLTRIKIVEREVSDEVIPHKTRTRTDAERYEDEKSVDSPGADGLRDVTYRDRVVNGEIVRSKVVDKQVLRKQQPEVVTVGTKKRPVTPPGSVWDQYHGRRRR